MQHDSPHGSHHTGGDFEELQSDRVDLRLGQVRTDSTDTGQVLATQGLHQHLSEAGKEQPELIRQEVLAARPISEQHQLLLFNSIFHLTTLHVHIVVQ